MQTLSNVPALLKRIIKEDMWQERIVGQTKQRAEFRNFREFVEAHPPEGLHTNINTLIRICTDYSDMEAVNMVSEVATGKQGNPTGNNQYTSGNHNNIIISTDKTEQGTSTAYTMRRLAKHHPELHADVVAGNMKPSAAAKKAGFIKEKFQMPTDAVAAGKYLAGRVDHDWLMEMVDAYMKAVGE